MTGETRCTLCGAIAEELHVLGWLSETDADGRMRWICPDCAREHARAIEARLDREWW